MSAREWRILDLRSARVSLPNWKIRPWHRPSNSLQMWSERPAQSHFHGAPQSTAPASTVVRGELLLAFSPDGMPLFALFAQRPGLLLAAGSAWRAPACGLLEGALKKRLFLPILAILTATLGRRRSS